MNDVVPTASCQMKNDAAGSSFAVCSRAGTLGLLGVLLLLAGCASSRPPVQPGASAEAVIIEEAAGREARPSSVRQQAERRVVRTAHLRLELPDEDAFASTVDRAVALAKAADGYAAEVRADGTTLRIPDARLEDVMNQIAELGEVEQRTLRATDVTAQYTDLGIRIENAEVLQGRLRRLLERADDVEDVLAVERELARVTERLERMEGQQRHLENQIAYATLSVRLGENVRPGPLGYVFVGLYEAVKWLFVRD